MAEDFTIQNITDPKAQQSQRRELILGVNKIGEPKELAELEAWMQLIIDLFYKRKGTPSNPDIGIDLLSYDYSFEDTAIAQLTSDASRQISTYLPDVPMEDLKISTEQYEGMTLLIATIFFIYKGQRVVGTFAGNVDPRDPRVKYKI